MYSKTTRYREAKESRSMNRLISLTLRRTCQDLWAGQWQHQQRRLAGSAAQAMVLTRLSSCDAPDAHHESVSPSRRRF